MNKILLIFLLLGLTGRIFAQYSDKEIIIQGYVSDAYSGEILSNAHIQIGEQSSISNNYGFYSMRIKAGTLKLHASYMGFSSVIKDIIVERDTTISVALYPGLELPEVVFQVNNNKKVENKGLGNLRINLSQLSVSPLFLGERDIIKTMQFMPGVSSGMEGSSGLNIRGGTNDQTLYLIDDVPVYNQNHTFGLISIFNPDILLSADMYKGGIPAIYGNRLSGVASIELKEGNYQTYHHSINIGTLAGIISTEGPIVKNKICYLFSARRSFLDLLTNAFLSILSNGNWSSSMFAFWDINGKISWKLTDKTKLSLGVFNSYDDLYGLNKKKDMQTREKSKNKFGMGWKTLTAYGRLTSNIRQNCFLSSSVYYSHLGNFDYMNLHTPAMQIKQQVSSELQEFGWRNSLENKLSNNLSLFGGFDFSAQFYYPEYMFKNQNGFQNNMESGQKNLFTTSFFVYSEIKNKKSMLVPGIRMSVFHNGTRTKLVIEPRIKLSTFINDNNKIMLAYDRMYQPIHSVNEMNYSINTDFWMPFSENVLPNSNQISIGWKNYAIPDLLFSIEGYYKKMNNLVLISNLEHYLDFHTGYQTGKGQSTGIEFLGQYNKNKLTTWLSYTLSHSNRQFKGKKYPFKYDAPHDISLFVSYDIYAKGKIRNTLSANTQYRSGIPYYIPEVSYPSMGLPTTNGPYSGYLEKSINYIPDYPNIRLKDYFRMDINFTMERQLKHGTSCWQFSLLNATARNNPYAVYRKEGNYKAFVLIPFLPSISFKRSF